MSRIPEELEQLDLLKHQKRPDQMPIDQLPDEARRVWSFLAARSGPGRAITRRLLEGLMPDLSERSIRKAIRYLILEAKRPICAGPSGYYLASSQADADEEFNRMRRRGLMILYRAYRERGYSLERFSEQMRLDLPALMAELKEAS